MREKNLRNLKANHIDSYMQMPQGYCNEEGDTVKMFSESSGGDWLLLLLFLHNEKPIP